MRAILEETLLDVMFEVPSHEEIGQVVITGDVVHGDAQPTMLTRAEIAERHKLSA